MFESLSDSDVIGYVTHQISHLFVPPPFVSFARRRWPDWGSAHRQMALVLISKVGSTDADHFISDHIDAPDPCVRGIARHHVLALSEIDLHVMQAVVDAISRGAMGLKRLLKRGATQPACMLAARCLGCGSRRWIKRQKEVFQQVEGVITTFQSEETLFPEMYRDNLLRWELCYNRSVGGTSVVRIWYVMGTHRFLVDGVLYVEDPNGVGGCRESYSEPIYLGIPVGSDLLRLALKQTLKTMRSWPAYESSEKLEGCVCTEWYMDPAAQRDAKRRGRRYPLHD